MNRVLYSFDDMPENEIWKLKDEGSIEAINYLVMKHEKFAYHVLNENFRIHIKNPTTAEVIAREAYIKDQYRVYCKDDVSKIWHDLYGADPLTFEIDFDYGGWSTAYSHDKNGSYNFCNKTE